MNSHGSLEKSLRLSSSFFLQLLRNSSANADPMWGQQLIFTEKHVLFKHVRSIRKHYAENTMVFYSHKHYNTMNLQCFSWLSSISKEKSICGRKLVKTVKNSLFSSLINYMSCFNLNNEKKKRYC